MNRTARFACLLLALALVPACSEEGESSSDASVETGGDASQGQPGGDASLPAGSDAGVVPDGGGVQDKTPPTVVSTSPADLATDVPLDSRIVVQFSEPLDLSKLSAANFELIEWWDGNPQGEALPGTLDTSANPTIAFVPAANLSLGDEFKFTVKAGIQDLAGNALAADHSIVFDAAWVTPDNAPKVVSVLPAAGATGVATGTSLVVTFNRKMSQAAVSSGVKLATAGGASVSLQADGSADPSFVFKPQSALSANTSYTLTVKGGSSGVKDEVGNTMAADFTSTFTTGAGPDAEPLAVVSVTPADGATGVSQVTSVSVTFNKPVTPASLFLSYTGTTGTFRLSRYADLSSPEAGTLDLAANPTVTFAIEPDTTLELERTYHLRISGGASGAKAISGAAMAADFDASFTVKGPDREDATLADLRATSGVCALRVKGVTMTYVREQPDSWKGYFVQQDQSGPAILVITGSRLPLYQPDPAGTGFPVVDLTVTRVDEFEGMKEVTASTVVSTGTSKDLTTVHDSLLQVVGDEALGAEHESEYVQVDGTLGNYQLGGSAENREFDLSYGTSRKVRVKVSQFDLIEPLGLANGVRVRITAPLQKDADGYYLKPEWYVTADAMTTADLDLPANYLYALDVVKLAD